MGHTVWVFGPWSKTVTMKIMAQGCLLSEEESYFGQGNIKKNQSNYLEMNFLAVLSE